MHKNPKYMPLILLAMTLAGCGDNTSQNMAQETTEAAPVNWSGCTTAGIAVSLPGETVQPYLPDGFVPESFAGPSDGIVGALLNFAWSCPSNNSGEVITGSSHFLRVTPPEEWAAEHVDFYFVAYQAYANPPAFSALEKLCLPVHEGIVSMSGDAMHSSVSISSDDQQYSFDAVSSDPQPFDFTDRVFLVAANEVACVVEVDFSTMFPTPGPGLFIADPALPFIPGNAQPGAGIVLEPGSAEMTWKEVWKKGDPPLGGS